METPKIVIHDALTGITEERDLSPEELETLHTQNSTTLPTNSQE